MGVEPSTRSETACAGFGASVAVVRRCRVSEPRHWCWSVGSVCRPFRPLSASPAVEKPSVVFPPDGVKWLPLALPGTHAQKGTDGSVAQIVELRRWLTFVGDQCYRENPKTTGKNVNLREPDWHYNLELDPAWLDHLGITDPNTIVRPGNVINAATRLAQPGDNLGHETGPLATPSPWGITARPIVHVEATSWDPARHRGERPPTGWKPVPLPGCAAERSVAFRSAQPRTRTTRPGTRTIRPDGRLPRHRRPPRQQHRTDRRLRVREPEIHGILGGDDPVTLAVRLSWEQGRAETNPNNGARWTELHPPDRIDVLPRRARTEEMRTVLVAVPSDLPAGQDIRPRHDTPLHTALASAMSTEGNRDHRPAHPTTVTTQDVDAPAREPRHHRSAGIQLHIEVTRQENSQTPSRFQATDRIRS